MTKKKIGLIGASKICVQAVINPVKQMENIEVYGITARNFDRAREYAGKYHIPNCFTSYEELLKCDDIDFVYIPLANHLHSIWAINAAKAKKHILLEKPLCMDVAEFEQIERACIENGVYLLEAVMVQHHPWQKAVREMVSQKKYGDLESITTKITFDAGDSLNDNYRAVPEMGGGSFYDLGTYWIQFLQSIMEMDYSGYDGSSRFSGPHGADWSFNAELTFNGGVKARCETSFEKPFEASHVLEFEKGRIHVDNFFRPNYGNFKITMEEEDFVANVTNIVAFSPQNYYVNQLNFFCNVIDGVCANIDLRESFERVKLMEKIMERARGKGSVS